MTSFRSMGTWGWGWGKDKISKKTKGGGGTPPEFGFGKLGDVGYTTIEITFDIDVSSPTPDYKTGATIKVNSVSQTINTATRQADHKVVYYVIDTAVDANDVITWEYDDDLGDIESELDGTNMLDVSATGATNYVGSHLYYSTEDDLVWIGVA